MQESDYVEVYPADADHKVLSQHPHKETAELTDVLLDALASIDDLESLMPLYQALVKLERVQVSIAASKRH